MSRLYLPSVLFLILVMAGCSKDRFTDSPDATLEFSTDSVVFDTVFNTIGTATYYLKAYNKNRNAVKTNIRLLGGSNSSYRVNVDGVPGTEFSDVEVFADDSIFIFIEVTVDPDENELYPFVEDRLEFNTNGNLQDVKLIAWGWDAIFYYPNVFPQNGLPDYSRVSDDLNTTVTWTGERPVVVYGYLVIDSTQTLIVEPGTQVFFHKGAGLWVYKDGNLQVNGSVEEPVVFQGDRLEELYADEPGQWDRIWINEGSENNVISNAVIKNNLIGIQAETLPFGEGATALSENILQLNNVVIRNSSSMGIYSRNYKLDGENVEISSCGEYLFAGTGLGEYKFDNCTFANNWSASTRQTPGFLITNQGADVIYQGMGVIQDSYFRNCIFFGNGVNEFSLEFVDPDLLEGISLTFENFLIRAEQDHFTAIQDQGLVTFAGTTQQVYAGLSPELGFADFTAGDFRLTEESVIRGWGTFFSTTPLNDIAGIPYNQAEMPLGSWQMLPE